MQQFQPWHAKAPNEWRFDTKASAGKLVFSRFCGLTTNQEGSNYFRKK
jgi:hypothetical protein